MVFAIWVCVGSFLIGIGVLWAGLIYVWLTAYWLHQEYKLRPKHFTERSEV